MRIRYQDHSPARAPRRVLLLAAILLFVLTTGRVAAQPHVVVSIPPYADLVERLAGPGTSVDTLLAPGDTPHGFDASPGDLVRIERADLVVVNGGMDDWVLDLVDGAGSDAPVFVVLEALEEAESPEALGDVHHDTDVRAQESGAGDAHDHAYDVNPHVWLDPVRMARVVPLLAEALGRVDPGAAADYDAAAERLVRDIAALHQELETLLAPVAGAPFVPFHDAWPHFAERYGLDLVLEIEPFPGREPSARALAAAVDAVRSTGARAIFNEEQLSDRPARVLANEAGVVVASLDPLGGVTGRRSYEELLRYNAESIVDALGGD